MPKIVLLGSYSEERVAELLQRLGPETWQARAVSAAAPRAALAAALGEADIVITHELFGDLPPAPRLRLLQVPGAGCDRIDVAKLPPGSVLCNVHEHEVPIAEYVLSGMLEWTIGVARMDRRFRHGDWTGGPYKTGSHGELAGKTLGIVGFGHIGREVAVRARAFGMTVGGITRTPRPSALLDWVVPMGGLDAKLPECDFLLLACPLVDATRGLIDARRLGLMKSSAVLINVARGEVADEDALYEALRRKTIAGAVLDVWYVYPTREEPDPLPSRRPFHELENVIMTPHASGWTDRLWERRWRVMTENLQRFAAGRELLNVVLQR